MKGCAKADSHGNALETSVVLRERYWDIFEIDRNFVTIWLVTGNMMQDLVGVINSYGQYQFHVPIHISELVHNTGKSTIKPHNFCRIDTLILELNYSISFSYWNFRRVQQPLVIAGNTTTYIYIYWFLYNSKWSNIIIC